VLNSLLTTKLYFPPPRPLLVMRPRLVERLQAGLCGPLTLVSAPPGSGKTSLLSEWRANAGARTSAVWLSLDAGDNDPPRFFHHLIAGLDLLITGLLSQLQPIIESPEPFRSESILIPLVNALGSFEWDLAIILDDYHLIDNTAIHEALAFLLEHLPRQVHLVLLTRADPPLPLARMRARGQLTEIRSEHLRFNLEEATTFLNEVMGLGLTGEQAAALEKRTEGWAAGLQLAALSMQGREDLETFVSAFTGSNHYIVDYLAEEVLARQPEALREFLLKTSLLERLCGSLCDALTGCENGREVLEGLEHANLFVVPLDNEQRWYRYHQLFADLLRGRLLHAHPKLIPMLHERASSWFEANGFADEAIDHTLAGRDYPKAARLICREALDILYTRPISLQERWLKAFPETFLLKDPWLCIAKAHVQWSSGHRDDLEPYLSAAQERLSARIVDGSMDERAEETLTLQGEIYTFNSLLTVGKGKFLEAEQLAERALQTIPKTARHRVFALGSLYLLYQSSGDIACGVEAASEAMQGAQQLDYPSMQSTAAYSLAFLLRAQGKLHESRQVLEDALAYADRQGKGRLFYNGLLHVGLAETLYEWNDLDGMEAALDTGLTILRQGGMSVLLQIGLIDRLMLKHARGILDDALQALAEVEREFKGMGLHDRDECERYRLMLRMEQGNTSGLAERLTKFDLNVPEKIGSERYSELYRAAEYLIALGRADEAITILEKVNAVLQEGKINGWQAITQALLASAWIKKGNQPRSLEVLGQAVRLAEPGGYTRLFYNRGEEMRGLLHQLQKNGDSSAFLERLLKGFPQPISGNTISSPMAVRPLLSQREVELLRLVAMGDSNKEIAARLVISLGTVKRHTVNIFNKLDVKNRTEAVAKAREMGLL
jgi:LuxR family maltose regulon positive regulatory protein